MLKNRLEAAHLVRDTYMALKLRTADLARQALDCAHIMTTQRDVAGLRIGFGAEPRAKILRAAALLSEAEQLVADAHPALGSLIQQAGLGRHFQFGYGDEDTTPFTAPALASTSSTPEDSARAA